MTVLYRVKLGFWVRIWRGFLKGYLIFLRYLATEGILGWYMFLLFFPRAPCFWVDASLYHSALNLVKYTFELRTLVL